MEFEEEKHNFEDEIKEKIVLVDFYASWCGPCRMLMPILEELSNERKDIKILKVNVDQNIELANKFAVRGVPYLILFKNGKEVAQASGFRPKEVLAKWIDQN